MTDPTPTPSQREQAGLLPCPNPWCKYDDPVVEITVRFLADSSPRRVECACGMLGPVKPTEAEAIAAWNTRADRDRATAGEDAIAAAEARGEARMRERAAGVAKGAAHPIQPSIHRYTHDHGQTWNAACTAISNMIEALPLPPAVTVGPDGGTRP